MKLNYFRAALYIDWLRQREDRMGWEYSTRHSSTYSWRICSILVYDMYQQHTYTVAFIALLSQLQSMRDALIGVYLFFECQRAQRGIFTIEMRENADFAEIRKWNIFA